jgi:hypothetical protein
MRVINLQRAIGSGRQMVAAVEINPYPDAGMPAVVLWGSRVFVHRGEHDSLERWIYVEVFSDISLTPSPGLPHDTRCQISTPAPTAPPPPVDRNAVQTIHGTPIGEHVETRADGMQKDYVVLTAAERAKGFVRPVRRSYVHQKCGSTTTMGLALAETYARDPGFYSGTFCCKCRGHFPVGTGGEFVWAGTADKVGT